MIVCLDCFLNFCVLLWLICWVLCFVVVILSGLYVRILRGCWLIVLCVWLIWWLCLDSVGFCCWVIFLYVLWVFWWILWCVVEVCVSCVRLNMKKILVFCLVCVVVDWLCLMFVSGLIFLLWVVCVVYWLLFVYWFCLFWFCLVWIWLCFLFGGWCIWFFYLCWGLVNLLDFSGVFWMFCWFFECCIVVLVLCWWFLLLVYDWVRCVGCLFLLWLCCLDCWEILWKDFGLWFVCVMLLWWLGMYCL